MVIPALEYPSRAKGDSNLTGKQIGLLTIREPAVVPRPCCTKPFSKVALPTQNS